jgi:hypothetical protein
MHCLGVGCLRWAGGWREAVLQWGQGMCGKHVLPAYFRCEPKTALKIKKKKETEVKKIRSPYNIKT